MKFCLVMCSRYKLSSAARAENLYVSERFDADKLIAVQGYTDWRIVSGKFGILLPTTHVEPYDFDLEGAPASVRETWVESLSVQLASWLGDSGMQHIGIRARGFYLEGIIRALETISFRADLTSTTDVHGSILRVRGV